MDARDLREKVESLQNLLISRATGGPTNNEEYRELRDELLSVPELRERLPGFVRTSRDLSQFWAYIQKQSGRYADRREHIWTAFNPVLERLESSSGNPIGAVTESKAARASTKIQKQPIIRAFISYSTLDKAAASALKHALSSSNFHCFLAHEDLRVSEEWKERTIEELRNCDIFVPLLSVNFKSSEYAAQEVGVIIGRGDVPIAPLSLDGTKPFGFISSVQSQPIPPTGINPNSILEPLAKKRPRLAIPAMITRVQGSGTYRAAEAAMLPLVDLLSEMTSEELEHLVDAAISNDQVWNAMLCRGEYLPALLEVSEGRVDAPRLKALAHQIKHGEWFPVVAE